MRRLSRRFAFGFWNDAALSARGKPAVAGGTRFYQLWPRDNTATSRAPERSSMPNGVDIDWAP